MKWFKPKPDPKENYIPKKPLIWWIDDLSHEHCGLIDDPVRGWDRLPWPDNEKCYLAVDKTEYDKVVEKLKTLEQENERLKNKLGMFGAYGTDECHECSFGRVTVFKAHTKCIQCAPEEYREEFVENHGAQLKERDQLIKELRSLGTCDIDCDGVKCSKTCKKKSMIFEKARKLIGEEK